jgi:hypothetical protein
MVKLVAESGCVSVFVGMNVDEDALDETNVPSQLSPVLRRSKCSTITGLVNPDRGSTTATM